MGDLTYDIILNENKIYIWKINLENSKYNPGDLLQILSEDEISQADRITSPAGQNRFIIGRGYLRIILGACIKTDPGKIQYTYNSFGKPFLSPAHRNPVRFNLSNSRSTALIAVSKGYEIGIDLEYIKTNRDFERLADRYFHRRETADLMKLPRTERIEAFYNCWCRKEAYIKARGMGMAIPLDQFRVSVNPDEPPLLLSTEHDPGAYQCWGLKQISPGNDFAGAVAANLKRFTMELLEIE